MSWRAHMNLSTHISARDAVRGANDHRIDFALSSMSDPFAQINADDAKAQEKVDEAGPSSAAPEDGPPLKKHKKEKKEKKEKKRPVEDDDEFEDDGEVDDEATFLEAEGDPPFPPPHHTFGQDTQLAPTDMADALTRRGRRRCGPRRRDQGAR